MNLLNMNYYQYMGLFSQVFLILNYWNFGIGMVALRSSISVQASKKIFEIINKWGAVRGGPNKHLEVWKNFKINKRGKRLFSTQE